MFVLELVLVIWRQWSGLEAMTGSGLVLSDVCWPGLAGISVEWLGEFEWTWSSGSGVVLVDREGYERLSGVQAGLRMMGHRNRDS